jgi:hypothetical protein
VTEDTSPTCLGVELSTSAEGGRLVAGDSLIFSDKIVTVDHHETDGALAVVLELPGVETKASRWGSRTAC